MNVSSSGLHHGNTCACSPDPSQTLNSGDSVPHLAHLQLQTQIPTVLANGLEVLFIGSIRARLILGKRSTLEMLDRPVIIGGRSRTSLDEREISAEVETKPTQRRKMQKKLTKTSLTKLIGQTVPSTNTTIVSFHT
jgi:hypothetical protein